VADVGDERELVVHTETFAPLETGIDADAEYVERVAAERLARYAVGFAGLSVEVVVARERLLGSDAFETKYAVREPDLLPGDEALIEECKQRIWETTVNGVVDDREAFVAEHARRFLSRRLTARNTWRGSARPPTEPAPRWPTAGSRSRRSTRGTPTIASTIWRTTCSATSSAKES